MKRVKGRKIRGPWLLHSSNRSSSVREGGGKRKSGPAPTFFLEMQSGDQDIIRQVERIVAEVVEAAGCEIWEVVFRSEARQWILRITLDREDGVPLDELTHIHRELNDVLDAHDLIPRRYTLEVSSPGINRPLLRPSHYTRYLGQRVRLQTKSVQHGQRTFSGLLRETDELQISIEDRDLGVVHIPWQAIAKAHVDYEFPVGGQKKKNVGRRKTAQQGEH